MVYIAVIIVIVILFNVFLYKGGKKEIIAEKGVKNKKEVNKIIGNTKLNELDASVYILYSIANWTPLAELEDGSLLENKNSLPKGFITEYFDFETDAEGYIDKDNYHRKISHITEKIVAEDEYDFPTKKNNIVSSAKFLKEKDFQFKRDLVSSTALIINRRPLENAVESPPSQSELEIFNDMAKILGIKTEYIEVAGLIQVEGEYKKSRFE